MSYPSFPRSPEQIEADHRAAVHAAKRSGWDRIARRPENIRLLAFILLPAEYVDEWLPQQESA